MRYRPLGPSGAIVSAISLRLAPDPARQRPSDWVALVYAALESGVNSFEVSGQDPVAADGLGQALSSIDRRLAFVSWRLDRDGVGGARDLSAQGVASQIGAAIMRTGIEYLDLLTIDEPASGEIGSAAIAALQGAKTSGSIRFIGVSGDGDPIDDYVTDGAFDVLTTPFNLTSGWRERNRVRTAGGCEMAVIGYDPYPPAVQKLAAEAIAASRGAGRQSPLAGSGSYAFLQATPRWSAEEICLAYALTEPSLASIQLQVKSVGDLEVLASVPDRDMPPGLAAQIEMARFSPDPAKEIRRHA